MKRKKLYIISSAYPYGNNGEQFFKKEVLELSKYFDEITIFPLTIDGEINDVPANVRVNNSLAHASRNVSKSYFFKNIFLILNILFQEWFHSNKKKFIVSKFRDLANSILQSKKLSEVIMMNVNPADENYFYSYWMNDGALIFSLLKYQGKISDFVFRVNGFDLFDERREGNYMPFRYFNFKHSKNVIVLSEEGVDYLKSKAVFPEKLYLNYYGMYDNGENPFDATQQFTIVSCSHVIPLKRIDKIIGALKLVPFHINWIHFGDGESMEEIKLLAKELPPNINYVFRGNVTNQEILDTYKKQSVNLFIHLSDTEGLGFAIIEAQSYGIPALAVGVGGVVNVVNENSGILVTPETSLEQIADTIISFKNGVKNTLLFRIKVKQNWKSKFDATINYQLLYNKIIE